MITPIIDLGSQPISNNFLTKEQLSKPEYKFDLKLQFDTETKLASLANVPDMAMLFNDTYAYRSSGSETMRNHFRAIYNRLSFNVGKVLEIGSNDGVFIKNYSKVKAEGVEPCKNMADITTELGYKTYNEFWNTKFAKTLESKYSLVYSANCMCHIPDIQDAFEAVAMVLNGVGYFVFEDPSFESMYINRSFDQIYDEHAHIFSVEAVQKLLNNVGLYIEKIEYIGVHGGGHRYFVNKIKKDPIPCHSFEAEQVAQWGDDTIKAIKNLSDLCISNEVTAAIGATSKSSVIYNHPDWKVNLKFIEDTTPNKQGMYSPGRHYPILPKGNINQDTKAVFLGVWNMQDEVRKNYKDLIDSGLKIITHVPTPHIV